VGGRKEERRNFSKNIWERFQRREKKGRKKEMHSLRDTDEGKESKRARKEVREKLKKGSS